MEAIGYVDATRGGNTVVEKWKLVWRRPPRRSKCINQKSVGIQGGGRPCRQATVCNQARVYTNIEREKVTVEIKTYIGLYYDAFFFFFAAAVLINPKKHS